MIDRRDRHPSLISVVDALEDDPFYRAICFPYEGDRRRQTLADYFAYSIDEGDRLGRSVRLDDSTLGVAVWIQPQSAEIRSRASQDKHEFLKRTLSAPGYDNYRRIIDFMSASSQRLVDSTAWYLSIIAVATARQGQGIGRRLLKPTLAEADAAAAPCYLETFNPRNVSFYERAGFQTVAAFLEPTTSARYAVMLRLSAT